MRTQLTKTCCFVNLFHREWNKSTGVRSNIQSICYEQKAHPQCTEWFAKHSSLQRAFDSWFYLIWISFLGVVFFCFLKHLKGSFRRLQILIRWRQTHLWCRKIKISSNFIPMGKNLFKIITEHIIKTNCTCWNLAIKKWELCQQISFWSRSANFEQVEEALQWFQCYVWAGFVVR